MKKILRFLIILALLIGVSLYLLYRNQNLLPKEKLPPAIKSLLALDDNDGLGTVLGQATENLETNNLKFNPETLMNTVKRTTQAINQGRDFFYGLVQVDETKGKNPTDRAIKYATYVYCKQVVNSWENQLTPTPSTND